MSLIDAIIIASSIGHYKVVELLLNHYIKKDIIDAVALMKELNIDYREYI